MIVSFFTPDEYYKSCAINLKQRCDRLGAEHYIVERSFGHTWIENVRAKPLFLLEMTKKFGGGFFWLDVDCMLLKLPDFKPAVWGVYLRQDGTPHDFVHYVPPNSQKFLNMWLTEVNKCGRGSHTAFINIVVDYEVMPTGYFELGLSETKSKLAYFQSSP